jgi:hypothetical protein
MGTTAAVSRRGVIDDTAGTAAATEDEPEILRRPPYARLLRMTRGL